MSFIGKAVKKVFKVSKKIWKTTINVAKKAWGNKWVRIAAIVGLSVFTAGLASGGFAAFSAASSAAGGGLGGFFSAVGTTMSTGFTALTGLGGAAAAAPTAAAPLASSAAAAGGSGSALLAQAGLGATQAALPMSAIGAGVTNAAVGAGTSGGILGALFSNTVGGGFMRSAIVGGISSYAQAKQWDKERKYKDNATIYGGAAFGGSEELPDGYIRKAIVPGASTPEDSTARQFAVQPVEVGAKPQLLDPRESFRPNTDTNRRERRGATDISTLGGVQGGALGGSDRVGLLA